MRVLWLYVLSLEPLLAGSVSRQLPEVATSELATEPGLEIPLELPRGCFFVELDDDEEPPRTMEGGVGRKSGVVSAQSAHRHRQGRLWPASRSLSSVTESGIGSRDLRPVSQYHI